MVNAGQPMHAHHLFSFAALGCENKPELRFQMSEVMRIAEAPAFLALKESPASGGNVPSSRQPPVLKGTASSNVAIEIVSDLQSVAVVWKVFEKLADCTPFQTFGWLVQ